MGILDEYKAQLEKDKKNENPQVLEFMDMQISEQTFGKRLCSDCLKKYLKDKNLI